MLPRQGARCNRLGRRDALDSLPLFFSTFNIPETSTCVNALSRQDLVEWQLRVASGQPLPLTDQTDVTLSGHAVEARICAEKVNRGFLPAAGTLRHMRLPPGVDADIGLGKADGSGIKTRVDTGVKEGDVVSTYYDPMVAKVGLHSSFSVSTCSFLIHLNKLR